jgi:AraC-like DNA-binding protein
MALNSTHDGSSVANGREVRAARLRAIKADILENLDDLDLTLNSVALRQRITPRYVHKLFEFEGITFSEFVLGQRLMRAHGMLCNPRSVDLTITAIAHAAGFGDLSYFNRTFRRRFGATPSELRSANACEIRTTTPTAIGMARASAGNCISNAASATPSGKAAIPNAVHTKKYPTPTSAVSRPRRASPVLAWR